MLKIKEILHYVINFIFPRRCIICDEVLPFSTVNANEFICDECKINNNVFEFIKKPSCKKCGAQLSSDDLQNVFCERCTKKYILEKKETYYQYGIGLFRYNKFISESIHHIKYNSRKEYIEFYGRAMGKILFNDFNKMDLDCFVPCPLSKNRYRERNYNQSEVLANFISAELKKMNINIPVNTNLIFRKKNTKVLNKLSNQERITELEDAFEAKNINGIKNICIVDDIYTTGSTIEAMANCLINSGIQKVYFTTIAVVDNL